MRFVRAVVAGTVLAIGAGAATVAQETLSPNVIYPSVNVRVLDRVTARVEILSIKADETANYGSLNITARKCQTGNDPLEPDSMAYLEIDDTDARGTVSRIFAGWMFAHSPSLSAMEHPVYDVWVESCASS